MSGLSFANRKNIHVEGCSETWTRLLPLSVSALLALAASVPPFLRTSLELTIPVEGFARIAGSAVFGVFDFTTTVYLPLADAVTPASRKDGLPFRLISRFSEKTTSPAPSGVPS